MDRIVAANWKMDLPPEGIESYCNAIASAGGEGLDLVVAPPMPFLSQVRSALGESGVMTAAQNCHWDQEGAYTGEVSGGMLKLLGISATIVGHSERRTIFGETDEMVARRAAGALDAGLVTVVCVGETKQEREADETSAVLERQIGAVMKGIGPEPAGLVIAYEPIWAIGTGLTAEPEQVGEAHAGIRELLGEERAGTRILYGGSVKPGNAGELAAVDQVDGFLVGSASLASDSFLEIAAAVRESI